MDRLTTGLEGFAGPLTPAALAAFVLSLSKDGRVLQPWFDRLTTGLEGFAGPLTPAAPGTFVLSLSKDGRALQLTTGVE